MDRKAKRKISPGGAKELKAQVVSELREKFTRAKGVIFTDYSGVTVEEITQLRKTLRAASLEYKVVKNTMAERASEGTAVGAVKDSFTGPVGIAFGYDDPITLTKKVLEFAKTNKKFRIKGGVIEGEICRPEDIKVISELPSKKVLLGMFIGAMRGPLNKLAGALNATLLRFVYAMEALKTKKFGVISLQFGEK